jgi:hypothetical protein
VREMCTTQTHSIKTIKGLPNKDQSYNCKWALLAHCNTWILHILSVKSQRETAKTVLISCNNQTFKFQRRNLDKYFSRLCNIWLVIFRLNLTKTPWFRYKLLFKLSNSYKINCYLESEKKNNFTATMIKKASSKMFFSRFTRVTTSQKPNICAYSTNFILV